MRVQISHAPDDRLFVDKLTRYLTDRGVDVRRDYLKTDRFEKLDQELRRYDYLVPVLSAAYFDDEWLENELFQAVARERDTKTPYVLPVQIADCSLPRFLPRPPVDLRAADANWEAVLDTLDGYLTRARHAFMVMKYGDARLDAAYELVYKPVAAEFGFKLLRIDEVEDSGVIAAQILEKIERSALVVADLTGGRPNCYFEAGYAHALGKHMVLTIHRDDRPAFDIAGNRFIIWSEATDLRDALRKRFEASRLQSAQSAGAVL
jgi:nucleoside 2-deoxyribosyltransferase